MANRRPYVEIPGTPPKLKELVDADGLIAHQLATAAGFVHADSNLVDYQARHRGLLQWIVKPGTTTWEKVGFAAAPTTTGTLSAQQTATAAMIRLTTAGGGTNKGEVASDFTQTRIGRFPHMAAILRKPSALTDVRIWCGLSSGALPGPDNDAVEHIALRYDDALDTTWIAHTADSGDITEVDTGITVVADTDYLLEVTFYAGRAWYYINGVHVADTDETLPLGTTDLGPLVSVTELAAAAKTLDVGLVSLWTR